MAKCVECGKKIGLFGKKRVDSPYIYDDVCTDCLKTAGYTLDDLKTWPYNVSWNRLRLGKERLYAEAVAKQKEENSKDFKSVKVQAFGENEAGEDLQMVFAQLGEEYTDPDDYYDGYTIADLKEEGIETRKYIYSGTEIPCELKADETGEIQAYVDGRHIGSVPNVKKIVKSEKVINAVLVVYGGKYRRYYWDEDAGKYKSETGKDDYFGRINITFKK